MSCEHKFIGFDAYKKAMDCLKPGDVVIFATPPAFRWVHFTYAIQKGLHTFMEKPVTVDGPTTRRMLALGEEAKKKNLKVGVGLMCRHCEARGELFEPHQRRRDRRHPHAAGLPPDRPGRLGARPAQARRHQRAALPDQAVPRVPLGQRRLLQRLPDPQHRRVLLDEGGLAGFGEGLRRPLLSRRLYRPELRHLLGRIHLRRRQQDVPRRAEHRRLQPGIRQLRPRHQGLGGHLVQLAQPGAVAASTRDRTCRRSDITWAFPQPEPNPYQVEWDDLIHAIRKDKLYNEVKRGAEASLVTSMGRMAAHTGQVITFDDMLNCKCEFAPDVDKLTMTSPAPLQLDKLTKRYPAPQPGIVRDREYLA